MDAFKLETFILFSSAKLSPYYNAGLRTQSTHQGLSTLFKYQELHLEKLIPAEMRTNQACQ